MTHERRDALLVLGAEGPGPTTLTGILRTLGMHAPTLEKVPGDGVSTWVCDLHQRLLGRANVAVDDARPDAWFDTGRLSTQEQYRAKVEEWLAAVVAADPEADSVVLEDAALPWFLELWTGAASRIDLEVGHVIVLDPPVLVTGGDATVLGHAVSWLNRALHIERATRGSRRAAIRRSDLLEDWTVPVYALGERWDLRSVMEARTQGVRAVHEYVERVPRPAPSTDAALPEPVRTLVHSTGAALDRLAAGADDERLHRDVDELRAAFIDLYEQAADIAGSTIRAGERRVHRAKERAEKERKQARAAAQRRGVAERADRTEHPERSIVRKAGHAWRRLRS